MASDTEATCVSDPNFAVICSFLVKFGASCGLTSPDFLELQEMLENTQELPQELIDLHLKLLRKIKKSVSADRWERVLIKLCHTYSSQDAWELERFGYKKARLSSKLRILKMLLEMQFDYYQKFKTEVNNLTPAELRSEPIGRDKHGNSYWFQIDECCQVRVYREDTDEETWSLVANDREGLVRLISQLASDDPSLVADLALNEEDSNSLEIEKPILDTGQTSSSTSNCGVDESSKDISSERTDPSPVETSDTTPEEKPEEKLEIEPPKTEIKPSVITSHKTEPVPEVKKEEVKPEKPVGIDLSIPQPTKGVDFTKRKKSINDLAANLRLKSDIMYKNPVQEQEMDLSVKKPHMDPKQFSSLSEPPFEPISIESALRMSGDFESDEEDEEEFFEDEDEIELPSHMKPRLDRPTLLGNKKKKTYSDEDDDDEYGDEIEEPVMYVRGEGSGKDCNNENMFSEVIEEPVMYFYGEGSGRACETGNEKEEKDSSESDSKTGACVDSDSKNETKKIGTIMIDVKSSDRTQADSVPPKKASRWDIGKPGGDSVKDDKKLCDDSTNNSIKDADIKTDETDNSCSDISLLDVRTDVNKLSELQKDAKNDIETKDCSSPVQKALIDDEECTEKEEKTSPLFFFGPGCLQFKQTAEPYSPKDSKNIDSKLDETENDNYLSESVPTNINKADILIDNKEQDTFLQNTSTSSENKGTKLEDNTEKQAKFENQDLGDLDSTTQTTEAAIEETESTTQDTKNTTQDTKSTSEQDTKSAIQDVQSTSEDCQIHENIEIETNKEGSEDNKGPTSTENDELFTDNTHTEEPDLKEEIKIVETKLQETDINKDTAENILSDQLSTSEQLVDSETSSDVNNTENNINKDQSENSLSDQSNSTEKPVDFEINDTDKENNDVDMSENITESNQENISDIEISSEPAEKMEIDVDESTSKSECIDDVKMETTEQNTTNIIEQDDKMESNETEVVESNVDSNSSAQNITDQRYVESEISAQIDTETEIKQSSISNKDAIKDVTSSSTNSEIDTETKNEIAQEQSSTEIQTTMESEITDEKSETLSETLESLSTLIETKSDESDDQTKISSSSEENSKTELQTESTDDKSAANEVVVEENDSSLTADNKTESLVDNDVIKTKGAEDERVEEEKNSTPENEITEPIKVDSTEEKENTTISKELDIKNDVTPVAENITEPINTSEGAAPVSETINAENESVLSETVASEELNMKEEEMLVSEENISEPTNISKVTGPVPDTINADSKSVESVTVELEEETISETAEKSEHAFTEISDLSTGNEERQITISENKEIISENSCLENVEIETPNSEISMDMETEIGESDKTKVIETSNTEISMDMDSNSATSQNKTDETSAESTISEPMSKETEKVKDVADKYNEIEAESTETIPLTTAEENIQKQDLKPELVNPESKNSEMNQIQNNISTQNTEKEQTIPSSTIEENVKVQDFKSECVKAISKTDELQENISDESNKTEIENTENKRSIISSTIEENIMNQDIKPESATTFSETHQLQEDISDESNQTEVENIEHNPTITSTNVEENVQEQDLKPESVTSISEAEQLQENVSDESKKTETESIESKTTIPSTVKDNSQKQDSKLESITATEISETKSNAQSEKLEIDSETKMSENISETTTDIEESEQDMDTNIVENISKSVADVQEIIQDIDTKMSTDVSESVSDIHENVEDVDMAETKETILETTEQMDVAVEQEEKTSTLTKEVVEEYNTKENAQSSNVAEQLKDKLEEEESAKSNTTSNENNSDSSSEVQEIGTVSEPRTSVNETDDTVNSTESNSAPAIQIEEETNKTESKECSKTNQNITDTESKHGSPVSSPFKVQSERDNSEVKKVPNIEEAEQKKEKIVEKVTETISKTEKNIEKDKPKKVTESNTEICETENKIETKAKITDADSESCEKNINNDIKMNTDKESLVANEVIQQNVSEKEQISIKMPKEIHAEGKTKLKQPEIVPIVKEKSITNNKTDKGNSEIIIQPDVEKVINTVAVEHIEENTAKLPENKTEVNEPKKSNEETTEKEKKIKEKKGEESINKKSHVPEKNPDLKKNCNVNEPIINKTEDPVNIADQKDSNKIEVNHVNIKKDAKHSKTDPEIKKNVVDVSDVKNKIIDNTISEKIVQNHDKQHTENDSDKAISKTPKPLIKPVDITKLIAKPPDQKKNVNIVQETKPIKKIIIGTRGNLRSASVFDTIKDSPNTRSNSRTVANKKGKNTSETRKTVDSSDDDMMDSGGFDQGNDYDYSEEKSPKKEIKRTGPEKKPKVNHAEIKVKGTQNKIILKDINELIGDKNRYPEITLCRVPKKEEKVVQKKEEKVVEKKKQEVKPNPKVTKPLLTCVDITKLKGGSKPENKAIAPLKQQSYIPSPRSLGEPILVDDDVIDVPETDPLACTEEDILRVKQEEQSKPSGLSLATFKLDDTVITNTASLIPEPIARALRNRKICVQAATVTPKKRNSIEAVNITTRKRSAEIAADASIKKRRGRGRPAGNVATRSFEVEKSSSEDEVEEVQEIKVTTPPRGTGKARRGRGRGRGRGGTPVAAERVVNDSPVLSSDQQSETSRTEVISPPPEPKPPKKKRRVLGLDIDPAAIIQPEKQTDSEEPCTRSSVRLSRRIAQQKIKEQSEYRKIEDFTHPEIHEKKKKKKKDDKDFKVEKKKKNKKVSTDTEESEDEVVEIPKKHKKKKRHQDLKKLFNMANPWQSSSQSSTSNDEEEEEEVEEEPSEEEAPVLKSDHEFSPESDLENNVEVQPLRRARTVKKESDTEEPADDQACQKCGKTDHPEWILLCDKCDCGWHCSCLRPALLVIPEGDWFCPPCQHISLIEALKAQLIEYDKKMNRREMEVRRKQRLAYVGISLDNVLPSKDSEAKQEGDQERKVGSGDSSDSGSDSDSESSSGDESEPIYQLRERRQAHSYRFNDYDELINSAIQDELEAVKGAGNQGRGKDIATIVNAEKEEAKTQALLEQQKLQEQAAPELEPPPPVVPVYEKPPQEPEASEDSSDDEQPRVVPKHLRRKKHRKLNSLDINSSDDDPFDDEDFKGTSEEEEEDIEDLGSDDSELDLRRRGKAGPTRRSTRARIKRYDEDFINDDSDDEPPRRKKNRSIWDESESEESDKSWGRRKKYKKQKHFSTPKTSKKRKKKRRSNHDSDPEVKRPKKPKIKYGGLNDSDDEEFQTRRTRGKKINYIDALGSDTDEGEERQKKVKPIESEDEYVANEEEDEPEETMGVVEDEDKESESDSVENKVVPKKIIKIIAPSLALKGRGKGGMPRPEHLKVTASPPAIPEPEPEAEPEPESEPMEDDPEDMEDEEEDDDGEESEEPQVPVDIPVIAANPDDLNEEEVGMMMENEEYAKKQLELMAIQLAKEKKKKEKEAKKLAEKKELVVPPIVIPTSVITPPAGPKKRGRKSKSEIEAMKAAAAAAAAAQESITTTVNPALINPTGQISPMPPGDIPATVSDLTNSPPKRRGRGKGKKTLAAEAAATGPPSQPETVTATTVVPPTSVPPNDPQSLSPNIHGGKLGIAAPPQPFAQNQPTPSVITRMLQSQPISAQNINQKYYTPGMTPETPPRSSSSGQYSPIGRGRVPSPYRQSPPAMGGIYPGVRPLAPNSPHRLRSPGPPNMQMFHSTHHSMDPSPSGGGPINIAPNNRDRSSPGSVGSPIASKEGPTPPPPPYSRTVNRYSPNENSPGPSLAPPIRHHLFGQGTGHLQQPSPPPRPPPGNFSPYHPPPPPNYHYGAYPPPPALAAADDALPPTDYQGSPYPEHYNTADGTVHSSEGSNSKPFDEEGSGEFGGLVSYFSSQREDDLDT